MNVKHPNSNRKLIPARRNINIINHHEENISSTIEAAVCQSDKVCKRLEHYKRSFKKETKRDKRIQWIHDQNKLNREVDALSKSLDSFIMEMLDCQHSNGLNCRFDSEHKDGSYIQSHDLIWRCRKFVKEVCSKKYRNEEYLRKYHCMQIELRNEVKEVFENLDNAQDRINKEIRIHKDIGMNQMSDEELQLQALNRRIIKEKRNLVELCDFSKSIALIDDKLYDDLAHKIETMVHLNEDDALSMVVSSCKSDCEESSSQWNQEQDKIILKEYYNWKSNGCRHQLKLLHLEKVAKMTKNSFAKCLLRWDCLENSSRRKFKHTMKLQRKGTLLQKFSEGIIEPIWQSIVKQVVRAIEDEEQYRMTLCKSLQSCAKEIEFDACERQRRKDEEREKYAKHQKGKNRLVLKMKLERHQFLRDMEEIERKRSEEQRLCKEKEEEHERRAKNRERVAFRHKQLAKKHEQRLKDSIQKGEEEMKKIEKLHKLAAAVPYHKSIMTKKADLTRSTAARSNDIFEPSCSDDLRDFQQGLQKFNCFTNEKIFSDPKFRLAHALHESGKANSFYSLAIVKQIIPRQKERTTGIDPNKTIIC